MRKKKRKRKQPHLKKTTTHPPHPPTKRRAPKSKKLRKILFKVKPLEPTKKVKIKRAKPKKPKLVKPIGPQIYKTKIKVIGIGGGGSSIISEIAPAVKRAGFVVANTDVRALQTATKAARHFQFGQSLTGGLGTGMNPETGEQAAESEKEKIKELLKGTDFCILVSCLGGGTGSGASPVFAEILKKLRIPTLGIFTLPFEFEKEKRAEIAKESLEKLRPNLNALVIIPNQKIFQIIDKNTPLKEALSTINKATAESLEGLITLIYSPGLIHIDFADLKTTLAGRGKLAYLNSAEIKNPNQIEDLTKNVLQNPLSPYSVQGVKEILFNIDGGLNLNMDQVAQIGKTITSSVNPRARVAFGITNNKKEGVKITLLANGCKWKDWEKEKEKPKKKVKAAKKTPELSETPQSEILQGSVEEKPEEVAKPKRPSRKPRLKRKIKVKAIKTPLDLSEINQKEEKKMLSQERKWETPAFLRREPEE